MRTLSFSVALVLLAAAASPVPAQRVLEYPHGIRSYGMGQTGVSDDADPANAFYNPAVLATTHGAYASAMLYGPVDFTGDVRFASAALGGGVRLLSDHPIAIEIGGEVRRSEYRPSDLILPGLFGGSVPGDRDESAIAFALGAGARINQNYTLAFGVGSKDVEWFDGLTAHTGRAYDVGGLARAQLDTPGGMRFIPSVGASRVNLGDVNHSPMTRVGVGLRLETRAVEELSERLGNRVPLLTAAVNVDARDAGNGAITAVGAEMAIIGAFSFRFGIPNVDGPDREIYYGGGIGLPMDRFYWRLDFANGRLTSTGRRKTDVGVIVGVLF